MLQNAFIGKREMPTAEELSAELGSAMPLWNQLLLELAREHGLTTGEWTSYSPKAGWALRLKQKKRNILYLSPCRGCFRVSFALGGKALQAARANGLPDWALRILDEARRYAEGTAVSIDPKDAGDIDVIKRLTAAKIAN